jgi:DNA-binding NarL/FixJ family response regulator
MQSEKRRVMLVSSKHLFGEGLEEILRKVGDVELIGPTELSQDSLSACLQRLRPDAVIVVESGDSRIQAASLAAAILQQFPNLPVISAGLEQNTFRVYSTHTLPARSSDLVEAILNLPPTDPWGAP